jgi:hypothetical protein
VNDPAPPTPVVPVTSSSDVSRQESVPYSTTQPAIERQVRYRRQNKYPGRSIHLKRSIRIPGSKRPPIAPAARILKKGTVRSRGAGTPSTTGYAALYVPHQSTLDQRAANNLGTNTTIGPPEYVMENQEPPSSNPTTAPDDEHCEAGVGAGAEESDDGLDEAINEELASYGIDETEGVSTIDPKLLTVVDPAPYQSYGQYIDPEMETDILFPIDAEEGETENLPIPAPEPSTTPPPSPGLQDPQITISSSEASAMKEKLTKELDELLPDTANSMEYMYLAANFEAGDPSDLSFIDGLPANMGSDAMFDDAILGFENGTGRDPSDEFGLEDLTMEGSDWVLSDDFPDYENGAGNGGVA